MGQRNANESSSDRENTLRQLAKNLRESSSGLSCCCEDSTTSAKDGDQTALRGWRNHGSSSTSESHIITMKQVSKITKPTSSSKNMPGPKTKARTLPFSRIRDNFVFDHYDNPHMYAEAYKQSCTSAYQDKRKLGMGGQHHTTNCCCQHWMQTIPDMVKSNAAVMDRTQKILNKLEEYTDSKEKMSFHVEWKLKNVTNKPSLSHSRPPTRQTGYQERVASQLMQFMKVTTYNRSDPNPFTNLAFSKGMKYSSSHRQRSREEPDDEFFCNPLSCSHGNPDLDFTPKPISTLVSELPPSNTCLNNPSKKVSSLKPNKTIVTMQQVTPFGWRKRPPLLERRQSKSAYVSNVESGSLKATTSRPQSHNTGCSVHNIQLTNTTSLKARNSGMKMSACSPPLAQSVTAQANNKLFRLSLRSKITSK